MFQVPILTYEDGICPTVTVGGKKVVVVCPISVTCEVSHKLISWLNDDAERIPSHPNEYSRQYGLTKEKHTPRRKCPKRSNDEYEKERSKKRIFKQNKALLPAIERVVVYCTSRII